MVTRWRGPARRQTTGRADATKLSSNPCRWSEAAVADESEAAGWLRSCSRRWQGAMSATDSGPCWETAEIKLELF